MMGITDDWLALSFDNAVFAWGRYVDNKLEEREVVDKKKGTTRQKWTLEEILNGETSKPKVNNITEIFLASGAQTMVVG